MNEWIKHMRAEVEKFFNSSREEMEKMIEEAGFERFKAIHEEVIERPRTLSEAVEHQKQAAVAEAFACLEEEVEFGFSTITPVKTERSTYSALPSKSAFAYALQPDFAANDYSYAMAA